MVSQTLQSVVGRRGQERRRQNGATKEGRAREGGREAPGEGRRESDIDVTIDRKIADLFIHHHATRTHRLRYSKSWYSFFMGNGDDYQDGVGKQCHRNDPCILTSEQPGQQRYRSWGYDRGRGGGRNSTAAPLAK